MKQKRESPSPAIPVHPDVMNAIELARKTYRLRDEVQAVLAKYQEGWDTWSDKDPLDALYGVNESLWQLAHFIHFQHEEQNRKERHEEAKV